MNNSLFINLNDPVVFQSFGGDESWAKLDVPVGNFVVKEGEESQDFYYIFSGSVKVTKTVGGAGAVQKHLATLGAGDFFGEGALLSDKGRGASVQALAPTVLLKLSQAKFENLVVKDPQAAVGIILGIVRVLNARLQNMDERLVALEHVAHLIREHGGNTAELIPLIFNELAPVTHHGALGLFSAAQPGTDAQLKWVTPSSSQEQINIWSLAIPQIVTDFAVAQAPASFRKETHVYFAIRTLQGDFRGVLCAELCDECEERDLRLLLTVAEQIGNLV